MEFNNAMGIIFIKKLSAFLNGSQHKDDQCYVSNKRIEFFEFSLHQSIRFLLVIVFKGRSDNIDWCTEYTVLDVVTYAVYPKTSFLLSMKSNILKSNKCPRKHNNHKFYLDILGPDLQVRITARQKYEGQPGTVRCLVFHKSSKGSIKQRYTIFFMNVESTSAVQEVRI